MGKFIFYSFTHVVFALIGFAAGIYALPILTAPSAPPMTEVMAAKKHAEFSGEFRRDLADSDFLHWGEGTLSVGREFITLQGKVAPGPDYKLYLSPEFVDTEEAFKRLKSQMVQVGDVKTFDNFIVPVPPSVDPAQYNTAVVWCESFAEFITAAKYR